MCMWRLPVHRATGILCFGGRSMMDPRGRNVWGEICRNISHRNISVGESLLVFLPCSNYFAAVLNLFAGCEFVQLISFFPQLLYSSLPGDHGPETDYVCQVLRDERTTTAVTVGQQLHQEG